jgi:hypothetical protein
MISLTAFAATSKLDQKQKAEFEIEPSFQIEAVNVTNENPFLAIITDVGWQNEKQTYQLISYHEKLLHNYNLNFKNQFKPVANMRSNC